MEPLPGKDHPHKKCAKCGQDKPLGEYSRKSDAKDGRCVQCKDCRSKILKDYNLRDIGI